MTTLATTRPHMVRFARPALALATVALMGSVACRVDARLPIEPATGPRISGTISRAAHQRDGAQVTLRRVWSTEAAPEGTVVHVRCDQIVWLRQNGTRRHGRCSDLIVGAPLTAWLPDGGLQPGAPFQAAVHVLVSELSPD